MRILGINNLSLLNLRKEPDHRSELVSQAMFGERYEILERGKRWSHIKLIDDGYEGWIQTSIILRIEENAIPEIPKDTVYIESGTGKAVFGNQSKDQILLMPGSVLPNYDPENKSFGWEAQSYHHTEGLAVMGKEQSMQSILNTAALFLHAPYLWGGKSLLGVDCSGMVQICYKTAGIYLPRDAGMQVKLGREIAFLEEAKPGDLAFFDNEEGNIDHVGLYLGDQRIIHSSGKVRIDRLDHQGIFMNESNSYSHKTRIIKRLDIYSE